MFVCLGPELFRWLKRARLFACLGVGVFAC